MRFAASGAVLLAFVGVFIGHTLEYLRVWGSAGVVASMTNPVHAYMLPVAGVLVVFSAVFALRLARAWRGLNQRLDSAAAGMRSIWRGRSDAAVAAQSSSTPGTRLIAIWLPLAAAQIALYVVQENVEAVASSRPAPGLGAISGDPLGGAARPSLCGAAARVCCPHLPGAVPPARSGCRARRGTAARDGPAAPNRRAAHRAGIRAQRHPAGTSRQASLAKATTAAPRLLTGVRELRLTFDRS